MPKAFVTGGSGFVGGALVSSLTADGIDVQALARSAGAENLVGELGATPFRGDLGSVAEITTAAAGCEIAFHAAALPAEWGSSADFYATNVTGTANVCEACKSAGVTRLVHVGTEAALMNGQPLIDTDEQAPLRPDSRALYSATKAQAEAIVIEANTDELETVVLRPRLVWGPGDGTILPGLIAAVERGQFAWIGGGLQLTSTTHIVNAVHGLRLAAERGTPGEAYFVTDGPPVVFREFVIELLATQGIEAPNRSIPGWLAAGLASSGEAVWRGLGLPNKPPLTRLAYWLSALETTIDDAKAQRDLGYAPVISREAGLAALASEVTA